MTAKNNINVTDSHSSCRIRTRFAPSICASTAWKKEQATPIWTPYLSPTTLSPLGKQGIRRKRMFLTSLENLGKNTIKFISRFLQRKIRMKPLRKTSKRPKRSRRWLQENSEAPMMTLSLALPISKKWTRSTTLKYWITPSTVTCSTAWRKTWSAWLWQSTTSLKASGPRPISKLRSHGRWWMPKSRSSGRSTDLTALCRS